MQQRTPMRLFVIAVLAVLAAACTSAEDRKAAYLKRGIELFEQEQYEKARLEFKNVLQIDPKDLEARYRLAETQEKLGDYQRALGHYRRVIEFDETHVQARVQLGYIYFGGASSQTDPEGKQRLLELAREQSDAAYELAPGDPKVLALRAGVQLLENRPETARKTARAALARDPGQVRAAMLVAWLQHKDGDIERALELLEEALSRNRENAGLHTVLARFHAEANNPERARELLEDLVALEPERFQHRVALASFHLSRGQVDAAEAVLREGVDALPDDPEPKLAMVDFLQAHRGAQVAESALRRMVESHPELPELRLALGRLQELTGAAQAAEATYREVIEDQELAPPGLQARNALARLVARRGDAAQARALVDEVLAENPNDGEALETRGKLALAQGDGDAAVADFRAALRNEPESPALLRLLAFGHEMSGDMTLAEQALNKAVRVAPPDDLTTRLAQARFYLAQNRPDEAAAGLQRVLAQSPNDPRALRQLFGLQVRRGDWAGALGTAERVKTHYPQAPVGYQMAGLARQGQGQLDASTQEFEAALQRTPRAVDALTELTRSLVAQGESGQALATLDRALEADPGNFVALNLKGEILLLEQQLDDAATHFERAIETNPGWPLPYRRLAAVHLAQGQSQAAVASLRRGLEPTGRSQALVVSLAGLYERQGQPERAIALYEQVLEAAPDAQYAVNNLAMLLADHRENGGSLDRALELARSLEGTDNPAYLDTHGWVLLRRGELDAGIEKLERAVSLAPDAAELRYHLGMAYFQAGRHDKAREHLRTALDKSTQFRGAEQARSTLAELEAG